MSVALAPLALVAAVARNGVVGLENRLPWHVPEDLKYFRRLTTGHAIVMGRKTFESIGKPLPNRRTIVVSRTPGLVLEGCEVAPDLISAIVLARETDSEPRIVGGAAIYAEALPLVTTLYLTEIDRDVEGDAYFPPFDRSRFVEVERAAGETAGVSFVTLRRR